MSGTHIGISAAKVGPRQAREGEFAGRAALPWLPRHKRRSFQVGHRPISGYRALQIKAPRTYEEGYGRLAGGPGLRRRNAVGFHRPAETCPLSMSSARIELLGASSHHQLSLPGARRHTIMASTPMDIDDAPSAAATPSLNITRTLGANVPSTAAVSDVISLFRPTKVCLFPTPPGTCADFAPVVPTG